MVPFRNMLSLVWNIALGGNNFYEDLFQSIRGVSQLLIHITSESSKIKSGDETPKVDTLKVEIENLILLVAKGIIMCTNDLDSMLLHTTNDNEMMNINESMYVKEPKLKLH